MSWWKNTLTRLFRRPAAPRGARRIVRGFRPSVLTLEDRTVPSGSDPFATATVLTGTSITVTGSNVWATGEAGEPNHAGNAADADGNLNSLWWQWTAATNGNVEINTFGSGFDTVLAVYTGSAVDSLTEVTSNDNSPDDENESGHSQLTFEAVAGTTYFIALDGAAGETGDFVMNLGTAVPNDNLADAAVMDGGTVTGSNIGATGEVGEPPEPEDDGAGNPTNSVWWQWTAPADSTVIFDTLGSDFDTTLAVYTNDAEAGLMLVAANNDIQSRRQFPDDPVPQSRVTFDAVAGTTYFIAVDGHQNLTGHVVLNSSAPPANHPPQVADQTFEVNENSAAGTVVGTVTATDPDLGQTLTYQIVEGNTTGTFALDFVTGEITVANNDALDIETSPSFTLVVQVTDSGTPARFATATITINLTDVNEAPVFGSAGPFSLDENSDSGTAVGTVTATDPDAGQTLTYSIAGGNTGGAFAIDVVTGAITVANAAALNFETTPTFTLIVRATDNGSPAQSTTASVTVNLRDVNELPVFNSAGPFSLAENSAAGTVLGAVTATDPDAGQVVTYAIVGGNTGGAFAINSATGELTVANAAALDFETTPTFTLTVRVTDNGSPALSNTVFVTVNLTDASEGPVFGSVGPFSLDENSAAVTVVGTVSATHPDPTRTLTYSIVGGNTGGAFAINSATGELTVANATALDFEVNPTFTLVVRAADSGSPSVTSTATVTVNLRDVNDAPVLDNGGSMSLAAINRAAVNNPGTLVSDILASAGGNRVTDQDAGAKQGIAIVGADTTHGTWQYSTNGGATWSALGAVSNASTRLLAADSLTRVRFVPEDCFDGTMTAGITFRAWDQTTGVNGGRGDASVNGGSSAFSTATESASVHVRSVVEQFLMLDAEVRSLVSLGALTPDQGSSLRGKLFYAVINYAFGNTVGAVNQMNEFVSQVNAYVGAGNLTQTQGQSLTAMADALIDSIEEN